MVSSGLSDPLPSRRTHPRVTNRPTARLEAMCDPSARRKQRRPRIAAAASLLRLGEPFGPAEPLASFRWLGVRAHLTPEIPPAREAHAARAKRCAGICRFGGQTGRVAIDHRRVEETPE